MQKFPFLIRNKCDKNSALSVHAEYTVHRQQLNSIETGNYSGNATNCHTLEKSKSRERNKLALLRFLMKSPEVFGFEKNGEIRSALKSLQLQSVPVR